MALGGMIGRIGQGMSLGKAPPIDPAKVAEAAAEVATGGKLAAAKTALKAAAPAVGGAVQGLGLGVGFRLSAIPGKIFSFFWDTIIANNNEYDLFIKIAAVMYFADFIHGFNPGIALAEHLIFAMVAFILIAERNENISRWNYIWVTIIFLAIWQVTLQGPAFVWRATGGAVLLAFALVMYLKSNVPMPLKGIPFIAAIDVLVLNVFRVPLLQYAENAGVVLKGVSYLMNRLLNPIMLLYGLMYMKKESPIVAGRLFGIVFFIYLFAAATPILADTIKQYREGATPLTSDEGQQAGNVLTTSLRNFFNFFTLKFVNPSIAYAYEKAEETFGFGTAKEEPKVGLQLFNDPTMPTEFDKSVREPAPSFLIKVPSPFPPDFKKKYLEVIGIECNDKTGTDKQVKLQKAVDEFNAGVPLEVYYTGGRGGTTITCSQCSNVAGDVSCWESKSYTIEAKVKYRVEADSYLSTSFMKAAELRNLRREGKDPAVVEHTPIEKAEYSNVPVTLTWGPIGLVTSPAPVDFSTGQSNLAIQIYVARNTGWEGEIDGIEKLYLTVPDGVALDTSKGKPCAFEAVTEVPNKYRVKSDWVGKFIGEGKRFDCGLIVKADALHGADWAPARFDVEGVFIFAVKKEGITFTVTGSPACTNPPACASGLTSCVASSCGASCPSGQTQCTSSTAAGPQVVCCGNPLPP
ncbi:hypothetical protein HYY73_01005 [Candidatus Woesearchaeota archaeon]|nr:hypothetical protein [Candidatus Woesearchaeota archaeon]